MKQYIYMTIYLLRKITTSVYKIKKWLFLCQDIMKTKLEFLF